MLGPNIIGQIPHSFTTDSSGTSEQVGQTIWSGAFYQTIEAKRDAKTEGFTGNYGTVGFYASKSNAIYGNSATVQPKSLNLSILIKYLYLIRALRLRELGCTVVDTPLVEFESEALKLLLYNVSALFPLAIVSPWKAEVRPKAPPQKPLLRLPIVLPRSDILSLNPVMLGPNIIGSAVGLASCRDVYSSYLYNGVFSTTTFNNHLDANIQDGYFDQDINLNFNASSSNSIYGSSTTVQPKSMNLNILIKY